MNTGITERRVVAEVEVGVHKGAEKEAKVRRREQAERKRGKTTEYRYRMT